MGWKSWSGKNGITPYYTILYLFRTLLKPLSSWHLKNLQSTVNHLIWDGRRPKFKSSILYRPKSEAGLGVPNIKAYHEAVILDQLKYWWASSPDYVWCSLEQSLMETPLQGTFRDMLLGFQPQVSPYLTIRAALSSWQNLHHQLLKSYSSDNVSLPLTSLESMLPDLSLFQWKSAGISTLRCLIETNAPRTFQDLQRSFGLPKTDFYKCLTMG